MKKPFYLLFISFNHGMQHNSLHTSIDNVIDAITELAEDLNLQEPIPDKQDILNSIDKHDDFFYEFTDSTWIHVQELSPCLQEELIKTIKEV